MITPDWLFIPMGIAGGVLGISLYFPQILKNYRTKCTKDISLGTYLLILLNDIFWTVYGLGGNNPIIYIPNGICVGLCYTVLLQKRRYDASNRKH